MIQYPDMKIDPPTVVVIGGGAAGLFGALACAETQPGIRIILCEKTRQLLSKVRISGGGRCNVTHHCFDPTLLIQNYPRGGKELRGPFSRFQPLDTIRWFESRGVMLKTEEDGRMFPVSDQSETIIDCLLSEAARTGIEIRLGAGVVDCRKEGEKQFLVSLTTGETLSCEAVLIAAGGNSKISSWLEKLGHTLSPPVPSLFTFNVSKPCLSHLAGICVAHVALSLGELQQPGQPMYRKSGPLLITHAGFSGPAVLKLSAWAARFLHEKNYRTNLYIDWLPDHGKEASKQKMMQCRSERGSCLVATYPLFEALPKNLWRFLLSFSGIPSELRWSMLTKNHTQSLIETLHASSFEIDGKSTNKEEFVTCGGVKLEEVNFKTMESKICPGLYFAGEVLDIDGVTGGFNFQNAWTTGWIAGTSIPRRN